MVSKAKEIEPKITKDLNEIVEANGGKLEGLDFRLKSEGSLSRKLESEMLETKKSLEEVSNKMYDVVRYTSVSDNDNFTDHYNKVKADLESKGYEVVRVKNSMADNEASYRGVNTVVQNSDGQKFELQFHTKQSLEIKEINHKLYEEQRLDTTSERRKEELDFIMLTNAQGLIVPINAESIDIFDYL